MDLTVCARTNPIQQTNKKPNTQGYTGAVCNTVLMNLMAEAGWCFAAGPAGVWRKAWIKRGNKRAT